MIYRRLLLPAPNIRTQIISNAILYRNRRNYCTEKCWEVKDYDEHLTSLIGNREMVGNGWNGNPGYADRPEFPFPSIHFKESTPELMALKEKERGDWRLLSINDKKELYRASYCQTYAEFMFPLGNWMGILGWALMFASVALWVFMLIDYFVYNPKPVTYRWQYRRAYLKRVIDLHVNPITGVASYWDYEKKDWKRPRIPFGLPPNPYADEEVEEETKKDNEGTEEI